MWLVKWFPKNAGEACQSAPGAADGFHSGGRGEENPGLDPHGTRMSGPLLRGLAVAGPHPTAPGATDRRPGALTISSLSSASADEPSTPFGLGERRLGDVDPDPDASPAGRAIGASGATGEVGSFLCTAPPTPTLGPSKSECEPAAASGLALEVA